MKVGDLIKFRNHRSGPLGIILAIRDPGQVFENRVADIAWCCEYTSRGHYRLAILEVINESR